MAISDTLRLYEVAEGSLRLTRVMSFCKFHDLLESNTLYFSPASQFEDKLEGNNTNLDYQKSEEQLISWGFDVAELQMASDAKKLISTHNQQAVVISCWTMANEISKKMWDTYTSAEDSLAIQTSVEKLSDALGEDFLFIPVRYLDFDNEEIPRNHSLETFFYKQKNKYSWEREVRIVAEMEAGKRIGSPRKAHVSLGSFITGIKFHPKANKAFIQDVKELVNDKIPNLNLDIWG
jgi:hypothetical protein